jgi:hypothetical protein
VCLPLFVLPVSAFGQESRLQVFPIRPFSFDLALRQTFTPNGREVGLQAGLTALRYGNLEMRTTYQYFGILSSQQNANFHSIYLNPRWNNFLDILDFPSGAPLNRLLRHLLFGPLEDRAVPYVGVLGGAVLAASGNRVPTYLFGGQVGVRFPVAHSVSLDLSLGYFAYGVDFEGQAGHEQQLLFTTGFVF